MKLTAKQKKFADNYIETGNATQSAVDAGYSKNTAATIASENLIKPNIKTYIAEKMKEIESKRIMSAQEALEFLTGVVRGEQKETKVVTTQFDVSTVEVPADVKTKIAAAKEILKRYPDNDKLLEAQIRKLTAEADIREFEAQQLTETGKAVIDDGFIQALEMGADKVWDGEEDES